MKKTWILRLMLAVWVLLSACNLYYDVMEALGLEDEVIEDSEEWDEVDEWEDWETEEPNGEQEQGETSPIPTEGEETSITQTPTVPPLEGEFSKWDLWASGSTMLRGANVWQAIVIPDLDGLEFKGSGPVGPPFSQKDFDHLAALGANYVTISGPGLFTEDPPYVPDEDVLTYMDGLLQKIANADMFATIGFRTGPGRSEFSLCCGGDPYFNGYFNDQMWEDQDAQDAWVDMWRYTAERYRDNPIVVGYKLMVEPNASAVFFDVYDAEEFYPEYAGTLYDWNQLYPRIVKGIREVDSRTPILVNGMNFSRIEWLPYLHPVDDPRIVYVVHQYEPYDMYTHQEPGGRNAYPGEFDTDWDDESDSFDRDWLEDYLEPVDEFADRYGVLLAVDEFGINRWVPGGADYMDDIMGLFELRGLNYSFWEWSTSWQDFALDVHDMNYLFGTDPNSRSEQPSRLLEVIKRYWNLNTVRPSDLP
jgi:hypothetical protein